MHLQLSAEERFGLLRRGKLLEALALSWNAIGFVFLSLLAISSASVALAGFALTSLLAIGTSTALLWDLAGTGKARSRRTLRLTSRAYLALSVALVAASTVSLITPHHLEPNPGGIAWAGVTALVMFQLAAAKSNAGRALDNSALLADARITVITGLLAGAVLIGLSLALLLHWWIMDPILGFLIAYYAAREALLIFQP